MASEKRFSEIRKYLERHGWMLVRISGSHHIFTKAGQSPISIPLHRKRMKPVYVRKVHQICEGESGKDRR